MATVPGTLQKAVSCFIQAAIIERDTILHASRVGDTAKAVRQLLKGGQLERSFNEARAIALEAGNVGAIMLPRLESGYNVAAQFRDNALNAGEHSTNVPSLEQHHAAINALMGFGEADIERPREDDPMTLPLTKAEIAKKFSVGKNRAGEILAKYYHVQIGKRYRLRTADLPE